jgi:predicted ATPase
LFGLLWALLDQGGALLLDEPELSLHPEILRYLPQLLARAQRAPSRQSRQLVIGTHSRDLLNDPGIGLDEVLLLQPGREGTTVMTAMEDATIRVLVDQGVPLGEVAPPQTAPRNAFRVALFPVSSSRG